MDRIPLTYFALELQRYNWTLMIDKQFMETKRLIYLMLKAMQMKYELIVYQAHMETFSINVKCAPGMLVGLP